MPIRYFPNDPSVAGVLPLRVQDPRPEPLPARPDSSMTGRYPPTRTRSGRRASCSGSAARRRRRPSRRRPISVPRRRPGPGPSPSAAAAPARRGRRSERLLRRPGPDFFHYEHPDGTVTSSGASVDVVAHETGHAWTCSGPISGVTTRSRPASFHEAFADSMAILTALADRETRVYLVPSSTRRTPWRRWPRTWRSACSGRSGPGTRPPSRDTR